MSAFPSYMPGPGDSATWPTYSGHAGDPRNPGPTVAAEIAIGLVEDLRPLVAQLEKAAERDDLDEIDRITNEIRKAVEITP